MKCFVLACLLAASLLPSALADVVELKNGDRITGEVVRLQSGALLIKTESLGDVQVKWDAVERITASEVLYVRTQTAMVPVNGLELTADGLALATPDADVDLELAAVESIISENELRALAKTDQNRSGHGLWSGSVDAGMNAARGNSDTTSLTLSLKTARVSEATRLTFNITSLQATNRTNGQTSTSANAIRSGVRYDLNLNDRLYTFGFATFESNRVQNLELRNVLGAGTGYRLFQTARGGVLDLFAGGSVNQEFFSEREDRRTAEFLVGQDFSAPLSSRTSVNGRFSFFPNLSVLGEYRAVLDSTANTKLNNWIGWQVTVSNIYVSNPPGTSRNNDLLVSTGIRVSLGQEKQFMPRLKVGSIYR